MNSEIPYKTYLTESELPTAWYNVRADMKKKPAPLLNPGTAGSGRTLSWALVTVFDNGAIACEIKAI